MRTVLAIFIVSLAVSAHSAPGGRGGGNAGGLPATNQAVSELQGQMETLQAQVEELNNLHQQLEVLLAAVDARTANNAKAIKSLQVSIQSLQKSLQKQIAVLNKSIALTNARVDHLQLAFSAERKKTALQFAVIAKRLAALEQTDDDILALIESLHPDDGRTLVAVGEEIDLDSGQIQADDGAQDAPFDLRYDGGLELKDRLTASNTFVEIYRSSFSYENLDAETATTVINDPHNFTKSIAPGNTPYVVVTDRGRFKVGDIVCEGGGTKKARCTGISFVYESVLLKKKVPPKEEKKEKEE